MTKIRPKNSLLFSSQVAALTVLGALACSAEDGGPPASPSCESVHEDPPDPLRWRRYQVLLGDLSRALSLPRAELCLELGSVPCSDVHQVALGGNDPFEQSMYEPIGAPLPLTPSVIDRVVLNACINRVAADATGAPVIFDRLDLSAQTLEVDDPDVRAQIVTLYRSLHGRDPSDAEVDVVAELARDNTGKDFATLACFTIASTTEMVLM